MSWATGLTLACLLLVAMYFILALFDFAKRGDSDYGDFTEHQWKDLRRQDARRRMEERGRKTQAGIQS